MKNQKQNKWYKPEVTDTGWDKDLPADTRRALMLKAHGGDALASGRAMTSLANATKDNETRDLARKDALFFYRMHQDKRQMIRISPRTFRITAKDAPTTLKER